MYNLVILLQYTNLINILLNANEGFLEFNQYSVTESHSNFANQPTPT